MHTFIILRFQLTISNSTLNKNAKFSGINSGIPNNIDKIMEL